MTANSKRALIIATSYGVEQDEIVAPRDFLTTHDVAVTIATPDGNDITTLVSDKDPGVVVASDATLDAVTADDFDILVIPGGTVNADTLRTNAAAQQLVRDFAAVSKPVAAICHAPWLFINAGVASGRRLTSYPSLQDDVTNAGAQWLDEEVVVDDSHGFTTITSRSPADLAAFDYAIEQALTA